ncbi:hypothetical protein [Dyadobacter sp. MSC1_007]|jgi:DNA-binding NarL/FixJ family response regulator|uniref:hypothetical protein n=1 Tax=Dyadobacter sp. MSC1_007 TaxID=2909264 RepID=UPI00202FDDD9|nr:hypothetical protein [Dyadobacter sp. MSC1_007]
MRSILLIVDHAHLTREMTTVLKEVFTAASFHQVSSKQAAFFLQTHAKPDLIVYAPRAALGPMYNRFCTIRALAVKAKILLYAEFRSVGPCLFDYLAAGANGLLSTSSTTSEHYRALDTVMRGDSFVDDATKRELLALKQIKLSEGKSNALDF